MYVSELVMMTLLMYFPYLECLTIGLHFISSVRHTASTWLLAVDKIECKNCYTDSYILDSVATVASNDSLGMKILGH